MPNDKKDERDDDGAKAAASARATLQSIYGGGKNRDPTSASRTGFSTHTAIAASTSS